MSSLRLRHITNKPLYWCGPSRCQSHVKNVLETRPATEPGSGLSMLAARFVCPDTGCRAADGLPSAVPAPLGERPFGDTGGMQGGVWGSPTRSCQPARGGKRCPHQSWWITARACGVVCCHQRSARWDVRLERGPVTPVGMEDSPRLGWMAKSVLFRYLQSFLVCFQGRERERHETPGKRRQTL